LEGYYRTPGIHGETIVFSSEGDLWIVEGGEEIARRLTTHHGEETDPAISPDGTMIAFTAQYEGPAEVYTIPISGGVPQRQTWERARCVGWTGDNRILIATRTFSTLPNTQLVLLDPASGAREIVPLAQAADGCVAPDGTIYFTRLPFQGSHTKRYKGGTAQNIWKFADGMDEAVPLTADYAGTSKEPLWWEGRVYFASDRDGSMNIWSMLPDGTDVRQHTHHDGFDVQSPALDAGRIVYQQGADLWVYDIALDAVARRVVHLPSDLDQMREQWIDEPMEWVTSAHVSPSGDRVVLTARGLIFVAPDKQKRLIQVTRNDEKSIRYREARFMPDGETILALSDESGEVEFWTLPADGIGSSRAQITDNADVLRWEGVPSPDGTWLAHHDKNFRLWVRNLDSGEERQIDESVIEDFRSLAWSPDSTWLAYVKAAENTMYQIWLYNVEDQTQVAATSDRTISDFPAWSPDGKWLWFLSDRHLQSTVGSPWGPRAPKPYFDKTTKIYALALSAESGKFPFEPDTELDEKKGDDEDEEEEAGSEPASGEDPGQANDEQDEEDDEGADDEKEQQEEKTEEVIVSIDLDGLQRRLYEVPVSNGNYSNLFVTGKRLYYVSSERAPDFGGGATLMSLDIDNKKIEPKAFASKVSLAELSLDREKILLRIDDALHLVDAGANAPADLKETGVNLSGWSFTVDPREEWSQMFTEAWRLERDYFWDQAMHGVDWQAMLEKYRPLVERVRTRAELSDLIAQMVAELSALHIFVAGGDMREAPDNIQTASLGALLARDELGGGYRIEHIYRSDAEYPAPGARSPLDHPSLNIAEGSIITMVNGVDVLSVRDIAELLRNQAGKQARLRIREAGDAPAEAMRDVIVRPIGAREFDLLRYGEWELTRREIVEAEGAGDLGYVHLRAMGSGDIAQWTRDFYPIFNRKGLILDVRHNSGGNIDSWILSELLRKPWFYWQGRVGDPYWNMQYAFPGHIVILCNERTASDGEAITEGIRRLELGTIIGTRTWGGEIWLTSSNRLVDFGIATAAEFGVYGPEGAWLIEGHGVEPDIVVDNPPHATFNGGDAQLMAAIEFLKRKIEEEPVEVPPAPARPNLRFPPIE
jgi:tricorn protease